MAEKKQSAFDRFSAIGAIAGQAKTSGGKGLDFNAFKQGFEIAQLTKQSVDADVEKNKAKTDALLKQFPGGISIPKMDANLDNVVGNYLKDQRGEYGDLAAIVAKGPEEEGYDAALGKMNQIKSNIKNVNKNLEVLAGARQMLLDDQKNGVDYSKSTSMYQNKNLYNLTSGDYESLQPQVVTDDSGNATMTILDARGNRVDIEDIDLPNKYDDTLEKGIDKLTDQTQELKEKGVVKGNWEDSIERRQIVREIKDISSEKLIKDYMFQNPELIDQYIANDLGVDIKDVTEDEDYEVMVEMFKTMPFDKNEFQKLVINSIDEKYNTSTNFKEPEDKSGYVDPDAPIDTSIHNKNNNNNNNNNNKTTKTKKPLTPKELVQNKLASELSKEGVGSSIINKLVLKIADLFAPKVTRSTDPNDTKLEE